MGGGGWGGGGKRERGGVKREREGGLDRPKFCLFFSLSPFLTEIRDIFNFNFGWLVKQIIIFWFNL